jgi:hypothetical protein
MLIAGMPKGPQGQRRPADVIANAVRVMRIATGEASESDERNPAAVSLGKLGGAKGGRARAKKLSSEERQQIAAHAAAARWKKKR